jgi:hypothetical protein
MLGSASPVLGIEGRRERTVAMRPREQLIAEGVWMLAERRRAARQRVRRQIAIDAERARERDIGEIEGRQICVERGVMRCFVERTSRRLIVVREIDRSRRVVDVIGTEPLVMKPMQDRGDECAHRVDGERNAGYGS